MLTERTRPTLVDMRVLLFKVHSGLPEGEGQSAQRLSDQWDVQNHQLKETALGGRS